MIGTVAVQPSFARHERGCSSLAKSFKIQKLRLNTSTLEILILFMFEKRCQRLLDRSRWLGSRVEKIVKLEPWRIADGV